MIDNFMLFVGVLLLLIPSYNHPKGIDERLVKYVDSFERDGERILGDKFEMPEDINVGIGSIKKDIPYISLISPYAIGICYRVGGVPMIIVDESYWEDSSDLDKEATVYHELGHCVLNRTQHVDTLDPQGFPVSLMYPAQFYDGIYRANREYFIKELFDPI